VPQEGDLIMFSGKRAADRCLRCMLNSEFNHIGLVVRQSSDDVLQVLEATAEGVACFHLRWCVDVVTWAWKQHRFNKIAVRRLSVDGRPLAADRRVEQSRAEHSTAQHASRSRPYAMPCYARRVELRKYVARMVGRQYERNPTSMVKAFLGVPQEDDLSSVFCSELVAGAYQAVGVLPDSPSANAYLPPDFASGSKRSLVAAHLAPAAYLSREIVIDFSSAPSSHLLIPELANFEDVVRSS
jgi:hypothetical protein